MRGLKLLCVSGKEKEIREFLENTSENERNIQHKNQEALLNALNF